MFGKVIVGIIFLGILLSLGSALLAMVKGNDSQRTFKALRVRIGLSLGLFALLFVLFALGLIQPHPGPI
ncbi:MAG: twin transmembrane helix small protein [Pseudomonadota bacterium]